MPTAATEGTVQSFTYDQLMQWANLYGGSRNYTFQQWATEAAKYGVGEEEALLNYLSSTDSGLKVQPTADGNYRGWFYNSVEQVNTTNPVNSNVSNISRGSLRQMVGQKFEDVQGVLTRNMTTFPASGGLGEQATYVLGSVGSAVAAVSTGIWLGKTIDSALYNANPDYWDSVGLSSLNPETWNSITNGDDSPFAGLFNFILGLNPTTGESQMYMDENALAYMAYALAQNGWFSEGIDYVNNSIDFSGTDYSLISTPPLYATGGYTYVDKSNVSGSRTYSASGTSTVVCYVEKVSSYYRFWFCSLEPFTINTVDTDTGSSSTLVDSGNSYGNKFVYSDSKHLYPSNYKSIQLLNSYITNPNQYVTPSISNSSYCRAVFQYLLAANSTISSGADGVSNQSGATLPDVSDWNDVPSTLQSLQQQYPDAFNNAMDWDNYDDDGTANQTTWVPVPFPNTTSATDTQPTSGTQIQTSTDVSQIPQTLIDLLTQIVQQTQTQTETEVETPPQNPVDTGTGSSPVPVAPTGSASALWSVYHPTQGEINSFGGWLWGSVFTTDIRKLFEDPIQGVIKLHKVFAPPVDAGTGTIVVGTLDSNVSSATVTQQYVNVDCGSVDCHEDFGNVFDYPPFTEVSLYLPFIGIVPLDTNDVMRSTIHVEYGVDVFTGACLAMVEVTRDGSTVNMYQYAGVCSVDYPLSNVQASNMLSGLLTIGAGIASIVASGGISAPAAGAAIGGVAATLKRSVGRSGGFSGNSGAMGIKTPYLIIERPQTKVADTFPRLTGYPTNYSCKLGDCSNHVVVKHVHVEGIPATDTELSKIESLLKEGVLI